MNRCGRGGESGGIRPARGRGDFARDIAVLGGLWSRWWQLGHLDEVAWSAPTRLPGWRVKELYAHVARGVDTLAVLLDSPATGMVVDVPDAAGYFARVPSGPAGAAQVARTAIRFAADTKPAALRERFGRRGPETLTAATAAGPHTVLASIAGPIHLHAYVITRIVEATVHHLDLQHALDIDERLPELAVRRTVQTLTQLTPAVPFIELATGRDTDRGIFPVLT